MSAARIALVLLLMLAGWRVWQRKAALELASEPTETNLQLAINRDEHNADLYMRLGRLERDTVATRDYDNARRNMERAVELRPQSARFLAELGALYEAMGLMPEAETTLRRALERNPRDAPYLWRLANLKLRLGAIDEALPLFGEAMARDRSLADAGAALLLKSGVDPAAVQRLWPTGPGLAGSLLRHLLRLRSRADLTIDPTLLAEQWASALADAEPPKASEASAYFSYLSDTGRYADLRSAWIAALGRQGVEDPAYTSGANALWNGDFERDITSGLIDWRLREAPEWGIAIEPGLAEDGSAALAIDFRVVRARFGGLRQQFVAAPGVTYTFSARVASRALDGPELFFEVLDLASRERLVRLPVDGGTRDWHEVSADFGPTETASLLRLTLRNVAPRGGSPLSGRLLLDKLAVRPLPATAQSP